MKIQNPVLKGFNPDPTMCYANGYFYIAVSTFQYYPGISIYKSKDLSDFKLVKNVLTSDLGFDLRGIDDSAGIWAPNLVFNDGLFYLTYTIVNSATGVYYDMDNYITTTKDIEGKWSNPVQITSGIFDPSLFFEDNRLYILGKIVDHRYEEDNAYIDRYSSIIMYQADINTYQALEDFHILTHGSDMAGEEGPQLFKYNDYYYLNIAEGGTEFGHQTTIMRSKTLYGDYELHPNNPILKSSDGNYLMKAGHSSFVMDNNADWFISHLASRVLETKLDDMDGNRFCPLGRETAIQNIYFENDWPYVLDGPTPSDAFEIKTKDIDVCNSNITRYHKDNLHFFSARYDTRHLNNHLGDKLIMTGRDSLMSRFDTNVLFTRIQELAFEASATIDFNPNSYLHASGISLYYDTLNHLNIFVTYEEKFGKCIKVERISKSKYSTLGIIPISIDQDNVELKFISDGNYVRGYYNDIDLGFEYNLAYLSDDYMLSHKPLFFTGMLFGVYTQDMKFRNLTSIISNIYIKTKSE